MVNLAGRHKAEVLLARYGEKGFYYVGNASADFPDWAHSKRIVVPKFKIAVLAARCHKGGAMSEVKTWKFHRLGAKAKVGRPACRVFDRSRPDFRPKRVSFSRIVEVTRRETIKSNGVSRCCARREDD